MDDDRICRRATFSGENRFDRSGIERIGAEAIDCFGGKGDQSAAAQNRGGLGNYGDLSGRSTETCRTMVVRGLNIWHQFLKLVACSAF